MTLKLLLAPHDDDAELFAAFTCLAEQPLVVVCTDSTVQAARGLPVTAAGRHEETQRGLAELGCKAIFLGVPESLNAIEIQARIISGLTSLAFRNVTHVWAPAFALTGHAHHNAVAVAVGVVYPAAAQRRYLTYDSTGKQRTGTPVLPQDGSWIARKLRAVACHESQMNLDPRMGCWPHFLGGLDEFYEA